ncbi:MAG: MarR family transcriptional regulator [Actinobacteria bacterium]|nr:MarR family transcriptional regulator [Actinomycetota bacterium]
MGDWRFLTNHGRMLLVVAQRPDARIRDLAETLDVTERTVCGILADLIESGYLVKERAGRRNRYQVQGHLPMPDPLVRQLIHERSLRDLLSLLEAAPA